MIGETVGKYHIVSLIGTGSMGQVYLAEDTLLGRRVAMKFLPVALRTSSVNLSRFQREAQVAASLNHPNIVTIYETGEYRGTPCIVMEYVEGRALEQHINEGPIDIAHALQWSLSLASALAKAHDAGIVHRDLKPSNIIIDIDRRPRILDFGVAKLVEGEDLTGAGITIGTLAYMAPEQIDGLHSDQRVDIWALGVVMYQMLTGQRPFRGIRTAALAYSILNATPPSPGSLRAEVPPDFERIVNRCLMKDPGQRYQSMSEVTSDLGALASTSHLLIDSGSYQVSDRRNRRGRTRTVAAAVALLAVIVTIVAVTINRSPQSGSRRIADDPVTLAILPVRNLNDPEYDYFANGLTDDLIARASKIHGLRVLSRLSVMPYKGEQTDAQLLVEQLGADAALEGSVMRLNGTFRATLSLVDLHSHDVRWGETFSAELSHLFEIQGEIVRQVAAGLNITLAPEELHEISEHPTTSLSAYSLCQRAREYYYQYNRDDNERAIALYQRALSEDSTYPDALAGLADAYTQRALRFGQPSLWIDSALTCAQQALTLDSTHADSYKALGLAYLARGWYDEALRACLRSLEYNPNHFSAAGNAGMLSLLTGQLHQALHLHLRAAALGPTQGLIAAYVANDYAQLNLDDCAGAWFDRALTIQPDLVATLGLRSYWELSRGKPASALVDCERALQMDTTTLLLRQAGDAALFGGDLDAAEQYYTLAVDHATDFAVHAWLPLSYILGQRGQSDSAESVLSACQAWDEWQIQSGDRSPETRYRLAVANSLAGEVDEAVRWYREAVDFGWRNWRFDERNPLLAAVRVNPAYHTIRRSIQQAVVSAQPDPSNLDCGGAS